MGEQCPATLASDIECLQGGRSRFRRSARDGRHRATRRSRRRSQSSLLSGTLERGGTMGLRVVSWHFSRPYRTVASGYGKQP